LIYRLSLLGWTQQEIGKAFGFEDRTTIAKIVKKFGSEQNDIQEEYKKQISSIQKSYTKHAELANVFSQDILTPYLVIQPSIYVCMNAYA